MRRRTCKHWAFAFAVSLALVSPGAIADDEDDVEVGDLVIVEPHSRQTPKHARAGVGYLTIRNEGAEADRLVSVACDCAMMTQIHVTENDGGVMRMRELADGIEIPAGGEISLAPGGAHLMFMGLDGPFVADKPFAATLTFERAGSIDVEFDVRPLRAKKPAK